MRKVKLENRREQRGPGVLIPAIGHSGLSKRLLQRSFRKVRRAAERHVLDEVGGAPLALLLVEAPGVDSKPDGQAAAGRGIGQDDVAQAVGQDAPDDGRIGDDHVGVGQGGGSRCNRGRRGEGLSGAKNQDSACNDCTRGET